MSGLVGRIALQSDESSTLPGEQDKVRVRYKKNKRRVEPDASPFRFPSATALLARGRSFHRTWMKER